VKKLQFKFISNTRKQTRIRPARSYRLVKVHIATWSTERNVPPILSRPISLHLLALLTDSLHFAIGYSDNQISHLSFLRCYTTLLNMILK